MKEIVGLIAKNTMIAIGLFVAACLYVCVGIMAFALKGGRK
jgi:hypothetical protein